MHKHFHSFSCKPTNYISWRITYKLCISHSASFLNLLFFCVRSTYSPRFLFSNIIKIFGVHIHRPARTRLFKVCKPIGNEKKKDSRVSPQPKLCVYLRTHIICFTLAIAVNNVRIKTLAIKNLRTGGKIFCTFDITVWYTSSKDEVKTLLNQMLSVLWKVTALRELYRLRPFLRLVASTCRWRPIWTIGRMMLTGENRTTRSVGGGDPFHCHLVQNKSHMIWPVIEAGPPGWEAGN